MERELYAICRRAWGKLKIELDERSRRAINEIDARVDVAVTDAAVVRDSDPLLGRPATKVVRNTGQEIYWARVGAPTAEEAHFHSIWEP